MILKDLDSDSVKTTIECVLPEQFFAVSPHRIKTPEARLMLAVLEDAVKNYLRGQNATKKQKRLRFL